MTQLVLIGVAAGAASALLALAGIAGPSAALLLFVFAGLPILIASIGWSPLSGLVAVLTATIGLVSVIGWKIALPFAATLGLPAWWLGYLVLLARPVGPQQELEWYPTGGLVVWSAVLGAGAVVFAIPFYGMDPESLQSAMRAGMERAIRARAGIPADSPLVIPGVPDAERLIDVLAALAPYISAAFGTVVNLLNLWLAGTIVRISVRLRRPWPDLMAMRLHPYALILTGATFAASFLPGILGTVSGVFATAMLIACAVLGLAVVHATTQGLSGRGFILGAVYAALVLFGPAFGWGVLLLALIGIVDGIFDIRGRFGGRRFPPAGSRQ
jgi:hypothetical protein